VQQIGHDCDPRNHGFTSRERFDLYSGESIRHVPRSVALPGDPSLYVARCWPTLGETHVWPATPAGLIDCEEGCFSALLMMFHATTVLAVRHADHAVMASDGQVTFGDTVVKQSARKIRRLYNDRILAGFAGSAADSFALFSRFEAKLEQYRGNLERSAVELAKDWRTDRMLRRLEAMLIVMDTHATYLLSGNGDLIEPDDGIVAIGSGGAYALAAAKALALHTGLDARAIAEQAMHIAAQICIYTNDTLTVEVL
jgi:ATP-dependent HslUV protease, peptidase subunit HslV